MTGGYPQPLSADEAAVLAKLRQPHLLSRLAENSLTVADSLRSNYFNNTAKFVGHLRGSIRRDTRDGGEPVLRATSADGMEWCDLRDEIVTFIDGGVGEVRLGGRVPLLLRVGSYRVKKAKSLGLRKYLGVPKGVRIFLDNGAFYFLRTGDVAERKAYDDFVTCAKPDWYPHCV